MSYYILTEKNQLKTSLVEHTRIELVCFSPCKGDDHSMQSRAPNMIVIKLNLIRLIERSIKFYVSKSLISGKRMAMLRGLEPLTFGETVRHSSQLNYSTINGQRKGDRTPTFYLERVVTIPICLCADGYQSENYSLVVGHNS